MGICDGIRDILHKLASHKESKTYEGPKKGDHLHYLYQYLYQFRQSIT